MIELAKDQKHLDTPVQYVVREFMRNRRLYISYYDAFADKHESSFAQGERKKWENLITQVFDFTIYTFVDHAEHNSKMQLNAQREMILELSSPVITLSKRTALLPLVGDIDTERAKFILENTLSTCAKRLIEHLLIDLSGVVVVDTMVAHQIFKLIEALKLIGVTSTLSGIRPEIAQTAVQLGINFSDITVKSISLRLSIIINNIHNKTGCRITPAACFYINNNEMSQLAPNNRSTSRKKHQSARRTVTVL